MIAQPTQKRAYGLRGASGDVFDGRRVLRGAAYSVLEAIAARYDDRHGSRYCGVGFGAVAVFSHP